MSLDEKIEYALARGKQYTPTKAEWESATKWQRGQMTWPDYVLASI